MKPRVRGSVGVGAFVGLLEDWRASLTAPWVLSLVWTARRYSLTARSRWPVMSKILPMCDVAPDFSPARLAVAAQRIAVGVDAGLVVALGEEHFADAIAGQRALRIGVESLLVLGERAGQVALRDKLLAFEDGDADLEIGRWT